EDAEVTQTPDIFFATIGENAEAEAQKLIYELRKMGVYAEQDLCGRSVKAQMKYADKLGAKYSVVLGDDEVAKGTANLKNMTDGETKEIKINPDEIVKEIK
ncbi:MAG: histidine--tRNA ligase, partial [Clostridia bacterium]|nr:histidine--tRNA ligase [Clostridia bacterium]